MSLTRDGNVGIATTSFPYASAGRGYLSINGSTDSILEFQIGASSSGYIYSSATNLEVNANGNRWLQFNTNGTEKLRITSGGDVCIGTTTVSDKLTINGGIRSMGSGGGYFFDDRSNSSYFYGWYSTGNTNVYFFNGNSGSNIASISPSTGVYTPLSDINKKKDFELSTIGLKEVLQLKPTLYRMKDEDNTEKHLGFIAQEVKEFIPQAYVEQDEFIGLNYNAIIATLVKAVQELEARLKTIENK
jgi:hypothetical protein